jgi:hypothetical protein
MTITQEACSHGGARPHSVNHRQDDTPIDRIDEITSAENAPALEAPAARGAREDEFSPARQHDVIISMMRGWIGKHAAG